MEHRRGRRQKAADLISKAKRPVILAGQGCMISRADKELIQLAETSTRPSPPPCSARACFPETHPLSLGMLGMHGTAYANKAMVECDLLINIGSRFDDRIIGQPAKFCKDAPIIHIDIDPAEMGKMIQPDVQIVGDAKAALKRSCRSSASSTPPSGWPSSTATRRNTRSPTRNRAACACSR
jgi:acetolactate synthase I/II/III large subunit